MAGRADHEVPYLILWVPIAIPPQHMGGQKPSAVLRMRMLYAATLLARVAGDASCW